MGEDSEEFVDRGEERDGGGNKFGHVRLSERGGSDSRDWVRSDRGREGEEGENGECVENVPRRLLASKVLFNRFHVSATKDGGGKPQTYRVS